MKKISLKDDSRNAVEVEIQKFIEHINQYHNRGTSIHDEKGYFFTINNKFRNKLKSLLNDS